MLEVTSTIGPEESNDVVNPLLADSNELTATTLRKWRYDTWCSPVCY